MAGMTQDLYVGGGYLEKNPLWHSDESPWKAKYVLRMMEKNGIAPKTICDVGCGAGEVLRLVQDGLDEGCTLWGYEISPQAFELCQPRANERLHFKLADIRQEEGVHFDLILIMDVLEHLEDYFGFLREIRPRSEYKIIHIPLDISVRTVLLGRLLDFRAAYGHVHYFTKDVALLGRVVAGRGAARLVSLHARRRATPEPRGLRADGIGGSLDLRHCADGGAGLGSLDRSISGAGRP